MEFDRVSETKAEVAIVSNGYSAAWTPQQIDAKGFRSLSIIISGVWIAGTGSANIEHADDDGTGNPGTWEAAAASDVVGDLTLPSTLAVNFVLSAGYRGKKQWVRLVGVENDAWSNNQICGVYVLQDPEVLPIS